MDGGRGTLRPTPRFTAESRLENGSHRQRVHSRLRTCICRLERRLKRRRFESRRDGRPRPSGGAKLRSQCGGRQKITWVTDALVRPSGAKLRPTVEDHQNSRRDGRPRPSGGAKLRSLAKLCPHHACMRNPSSSQIPASSIRACPTSDLFPGFAQRHRHIHLFLAAIDRHPHRVPRAMIIHDLSERLLIVDTLPINRDD